MNRMILSLSLCSMAAFGAQNTLEEAKAEFEKELPGVLKDLNERCGTEISTVQTELENIKKPGDAAGICIYTLKGIERFCRAPIYAKALAKELKSVSCVRTGAQDSDSDTLKGGASVCAMRNMGLSKGAFTVRLANCVNSAIDESVDKVLRTELDKGAGAGLKPFQEEAKAAFDKKLPDVLESLNKKCGTEISTVTTDFENLPAGDRGGACVEVIDGLGYFCEKPTYGKVFGKALTGISCLRAGALNRREKDSLKSSGASECSLRNMSFKKGQFTVLEADCHSNVTQSVEHFLRQTLDSTEGPGLKPFQQALKTEFDEAAASEIESLNGKCGTQISSISLDFASLQPEQRHAGAICLSALGEVVSNCSSPKFKKGVAAAKLKNVKCVINGPPCGKDTYMRDGSMSCTVHALKVNKGTFSIQVDDRLGNVQESLNHVFMK